MTPATVRLIGRAFVGIAILILVAVLAGRFALIPRIQPMSTFVVTALLFSVVGRSHQRRAKRMQTTA